MKAFMEDAVLAVAVFAMVAIGSVMALDAWTYETYGDCDQCMVLGGYFEMRGE